MNMLFTDWCSVVCYIQSIFLRTWARGTLGCADRNIMEHIGRVAANNTADFFSVDPLCWTWQLLRHKLELGGPKGLKKHGPQQWSDLVIELVRLVRPNCLWGWIFFSLACFGCHVQLEILVFFPGHLGWAWASDGLWASTAYRHRQLVIFFQADAFFSKSQMSVTFASTERSCL